MNACFEQSVSRSRNHIVRCAAAAIIVVALVWLASKTAAAQSTLPEPAAVEEVSYDDFSDNALNADLWTVISSPTGPTLDETNQQLEITIPANSAGTTFYAGYKSNCYLSGDYDIQVDYRLLAWPPTNGVRLGLQTSKTIERVSRSTQDDAPVGEVYCADFLEDGVAFARTTDHNGTLRLTRTGDTLTAFYGSAGASTALYSGSITNADVRFTIFAWSHDQFFADQTAKIAFDNMRVNHGRLICPHTPDLLVETVSPVQVVEDQPLVTQKATAVKTVIRKNASTSLANVTAQLTYGALTLNEFYVADAANLSTQHALSGNNAAYPLNFAADEITKTIYFFSDLLSPTVAGSYAVTVTVDYLDEIAEIDESNNAQAGAAAIFATNWGIPLDLRLGFFRVDWGNNPIAAFDQYAQGSSTFVQAVFPVSDPQFTTSKASFPGSTTTFRGADNKLSLEEFEKWLMQTIIQFRHADLDTDRFIAVVPAGWFAASTEWPKFVGVTFREIPELTVQEARLTTAQGIGETVAHELGHTYGLRLDCEEYDSGCNPTIKNGIGNSAANGLWVARRIPIIPEEVVRNIYCFMGAFIPMSEFWVDADDYARLLDARKSLPSLRTTTTGQSLLTAGILYNDGAVVLDDWYILPPAEHSPLTPGPYTFEFQDIGGAVLAQVSFTATFALEGEPITQAPFVLTLPYVAGTAKVAVKLNGETKAEKTISSHAPTVTITAPNGSELIGGQTTIRWSSSDADGDSLRYLLLKSTDNGAKWEPLAGDLTTTDYLWDLTGVPPGSGYRVKVVATDGFNTGNDSSDAAFTVTYQVFMSLIAK